MKRKAVQLIGSILLGGFILSSAGSVFAASTDSSAGQTQFRNRPAYQNHAGAREFNLTSQLSKLVTDGTFTQDQLDTVLKAFFERREPGQKQQGSKPDDTLSQLVSNGTLTQDQADAILKVLPQRPEPGQKPQGTKHEGFFSQLVSDGAITQEQADAIMEALRQGHTKHEEVLSQLVSDGTITQEQADAIMNQLPQHPVPGTRN